MSSMNSPAAKSAIQDEVSGFAARKITLKPVYLDTETTGLEKQDEIVEISILEYDGSVLFQSFVKPLTPLSPAATRIHGITDEMVARAPAWPVIWPQVRSTLFGRLIAAYNAPFDLRMMQQTHTKYRLLWHDSFDWLDVMTIYSNYRGIWDPFRKSMKLFSLEDAGRSLNITLQNAHRATADCLLTRAVLHSIAGEPY